MGPRAGSDHCIARDRTTADDGFLARGAAIMLWVSDTKARSALAAVELETAFTPIVFGGHRSRSAEGTNM